MIFNWRCSSRNIWIAQWIKKVNCWLIENHFCSMKMKLKSVFGRRRHLQDRTFQMQVERYVCFHARTKSPLPGASVRIVPLSQPCPVSFYFKNCCILTYVTYVTENIREVVRIRHIRMWRNKLLTTDLLWLAIAKTPTKAPLGDTSKHKKILDGVDLMMEPPGNWTPARTFLHLT